MDLSRRLFGIETEYGILVEGREVHDLMEEARLLVRAYPGVWAGPWDYAREDPRRDMRGFRVDHLNENPADAAYEPRGPAITVEEQRSKRPLAHRAHLYNDHRTPPSAHPRMTTRRAHGAAGPPPHTHGPRLYNDHGHPEYATPECATLKDLVAHDRAGERIVLACAAARLAEAGRRVTLFKNNTDFH